ncbi:MAG: thiamine phosphate synthase [Propionibacteriales bacterium]|nr:thiamine phosphate synthase [Propionibacteriales bacterium]
MSSRPIARCHLVTDTRDRRDPLTDVQAALRAGIRLVQVRAKQGTDRDLLALTRAVLRLARPRDVTVLVDDRADIALAAGAHGVHVGVGDLPVEEVRRILGPGAVIGATARDPQAARVATAAGADYLGVGPAYATTSKAGLPDPLGLDGVTAVARSTRLPVIAIGGIGPDEIPALLQRGVHGVAVLSAISGAADPGAAATQILKTLDV